MRAMNLARGASLENTLALDDTGVVNAGLMRFPDEFVRHKILDAIGDMALAGRPLQARFQASVPAMPSIMPCSGRFSPTPALTASSPFPEGGSGVL